LGFRPVTHKETARMGNGRYPARLGVESLAQLSQLLAGRIVPARTETKRTRLQRTPCNQRSREEGKEKKVH